jgi:probable phosphoglycerate mutase
MATGARVDPTFLLGVSGVTELVLVRHAKQAVSDNFLDQTVGDLHDPPLAEVGQRQAKAVAAALTSTGQAIDAVYCSVSQRARDTAAAIASDAGLDAITVDGIEEIGFFRDLPPDQTPLEALGEARFHGFQRHWARTRRWDAWPASEPGSEFCSRVIDGLEGLIAAHPGQRVVVVTHGGSINAFVGDILGTRDDMFFTPAHASITRVRAKHDRRVVSTLNELQHLSGPDDLLTF